MAVRVMPEKQKRRGLLRELLLLLLHGPEQSYSDEDAHVQSSFTLRPRVDVPNELQPAEALMRDCTDKVLRWQTQL